MDETLKAFVKRQNITNYTERLKTETDAVQRGKLLRLLVEEEAKQVNRSLNENMWGSYRLGSPR